MGRRGPVAATEGARRAKGARVRPWHTATTRRAQKLPEGAFEGRARFVAGMVETLVQAIGAEPVIVGAPSPLLKELREWLKLARQVDHDVLRMAPIGEPDEDAEDRELTDILSN